MELSRNDVLTPQKRSSLGRCQHFFWLGVLFDTVGVVVLFTGVFADLLFYDLLLYLGSIIIFFSLLWWVFWYTGNIEMPADESFLFATPFHVHSSTLVEALRQSVNRRHFSLNIFNVSSTFMRIRKQRRRRAVGGTPSLSMTVTGQLEKQPKKEEKKNVSESIESIGFQGFGGENLGPESEAVRSSESVHSPGLDADPPWFLKRSPSQLVLPVFTESPLDLYPRTLSSSKEFLAPAMFVSKSQPAVHVALTTQPPVPLGTKSQPTVPSPSTTQPPVPHASKSHPAIPMASQNQLWNLVQAPTQTVQASQSQAVATQVSLMQPQSDLSFLTKPVHSQVSQAVQDSQALYLTQPSSQTRSLAQEISPRQPWNVQEFHNKPVAQVSESRSPQELADTPSPASKTAAPVTQSQGSVPTKSAPASAAEEQYSLL